LLFVAPVRTPNKHAQYALAYGKGWTVKRCAFACHWRGR